MQTRKVVLWTVGLLALVGAGVRFACFAGGDTKQGGYEARTHGVCLNCETEQVVTHSNEEIPPFECENCGEQAVYPWFYCDTSGKLFVPELVRDAQGILRLPAFPRSPISGTDHWKYYMPEDPTQSPTGKHPLPEWSP